MMVDVIALKDGRTAGIFDFDQVIELVEKEMGYDAREYLMSSFDDLKDEISDLTEENGRLVEAI